MDDLLPLRMAPRLARVLRMGTPAVSIVQPDWPPTLTGVLLEPVGSKLSFVLKVHAQNGIPLAYAPIEMAPGDHSFAAQALQFMGMEGYAHLAQSDRKPIEDRIWSRRAFATGTLHEDAGGADGRVNET